MMEAIAKINEGVSGSGNALVDLRDLPASGAADEVDRLRERVLGMALENPRSAWTPTSAAFRERRRHRRGADHRSAALTSPSVQMRALPDGTVELLSTHDQLLGGPSGQSYLGCIFPAAPDVRRPHRRARPGVGRHLAALGVLGRFAVDFVAVQDDEGAWSAYAIELNLRKGGTTHPFLTLQFLTGGCTTARPAAPRPPTGARSTSWPPTTSRTTALNRPHGRRRVRRRGAPPACTSTPSDRRGRCCT